jgi:plastocyanin
MRHAAALLLAMTPSGAAAGSLAVELRDARGGRVDAGVVWAVPEGRRPAPPSRQAVMDQRNRTFVPHVLPIQTGTAVRFPNSDNVRHQVYSFSPAKKFQLPLYAGTPAGPVVFEKPGVVMLGCNIHDRMSAFIVVVDSPYFASLKDGRAVIADLPEGRYAVHAWYEGMRGETVPQNAVIAGDERQELVFSLPAR